MSAVVINEVRRGFYLDSVALMRISREVAGRPGVRDAALMMATPANKAILAEAGLLCDGSPELQPNDLLIALRADSEAAAQAALDYALEALDKPKMRSAEAEQWRPRSLRAAVARMPDAKLALISVPGEFAAAEARKALRRGLHVMMFSDNVALGDELTLKQEARERGLLMMGPDCGTAIIAGAPLAFANRVRRGAIGIVGASGTGIQEVSSLISEAGGGISHALGVGGRDLSVDIGAIATLMALDALDRSKETERVVLISKPPHPDVAALVAARIARSRKPHVVCFLSAGALDLPSNAIQVDTLKAAAEAALDGRTIGKGFDGEAIIRGARNNPARGGRVMGLFVGGTLCAEAQIVFSAAGRRVVSNVPVPGAQPSSACHSDDYDQLLDLGADEYTRGRPHPMIMPAVRDEALDRALSRPDVGVVIVDLVIGHGAHPDPAGHVASVIERHAGYEPRVVASVTGTEADPQIRSLQVKRLERAGAIVAPSNAQACALALALVTAQGWADPCVV